MTTPLSSHRRHVLRLAAASATSLCLPRSAWSHAKVQGDPFTMGVASGAPTQDSVVLWTRLALPGTFAAGAGMSRPAVPKANSTAAGGEGTPVSPVTVRWELAHDDKFSGIVQSGQTQASAELAHSVHLEVAGLESDRWYFYRFMTGDAVSPTGRTRTFAKPDAIVGRMRLAYASCQRWEHGYFSAYRHMLQEDLDAVLFLGDYIYEYPNAKAAVRKPTGGWALTLDDYRQRYTLYKGDADLQALHAACPWLVTWDDHEVQNDYAGAHAGNSGTPVADFAARRADAYQAFYEHMPVPASALTRAIAGLASGAEMRIYTQVRHGRLAHLRMLDARQYRDAQACTRNGSPGSDVVDPATCTSWEDARRSMLGDQQERWLDNSLANASSGAAWNVFGQQTLFGQRDFRRGPDRFLWNDGWDGYPAARTRLTDSLRRHAVPNPVLLGGDVHENWVGQVKADFRNPRSPAVGVEFCGTSITSRSDGGDKTPERLAENPHFVFADTQRKGYGVADFTTAQLTTSLRVVDDVTRQDTKIETLASFSVKAGQSVVERI